MKGKLVIVMVGLPARGKSTMDPETGQIATVVAARPNPRDPVVRAEALSLGVLLQADKQIADDPAAVQIYLELSRESFSVPTYGLIYDAIEAAGGPGGVDGDWVGEVLEQAGPDLTSTVSQLAVTPLPHDKPGELGVYARSVLARLLDHSLTRRIADVRGRMQRAGAGTEGAQEAFAEMIALEQRRRELREM